MASDSPLWWAEVDQRPAPSHADPRAVLAVLAAGAVSVVGLWWFSTPSVNGFADWLTGAGRITGLLAGYGVVVLVALMARIPALERGVGSDRLARWHAMGGRYTVSIVVVHALLITWGYAVQAHTNVFSQTWTLWRSYPDVLAASVAGLLLVGVGAVSARAARRRMRYETWYYLHFYTYLAIALAFSHQFAVGAEFISNTAARAVWAAMYIVVGGLLLWYRFLTPVRQALRHRMVVSQVIQEGPGVVSLLISGRHLEELQTEPGQFFRWRILTRELWWSANPYSLSAPAAPHLMRITVKDFGDHSRSLAHVRPGTRVFAEGPYGSFTAYRRKRPRVLLIAAGVGITPIRTLFETLPAKPGDLTVVYRAASNEDVLFRAELESIAAARAARLYIVTGSRRSLGADPLSAAAFAGVPGIAHHEVYLCGPPDMQESVTAALRANGVPRRHIHAESFAF